MDPLDKVSKALDFVTEGVHNTPTPYYPPRRLNAYRSVSTTPTEVLKQNIANVINRTSDEAFLSRLGKAFLSLASGVPYLAGALITLVQVIAENAFLLMGGAAAIAGGTAGAIVGSLIGIFAMALGVKWCESVKIGASIGSDIPAFTVRLGEAVVCEPLRILSNTLGKLLRNIGITGLESVKPSEIRMEFNGSAAYLAIHDRPVMDSLEFYEPSTFKDNMKFLINRISHPTQ
jgi:hypothetical protein